MQPLHSRIDLACEQLDVAIELFLVERSFVSSLTLAGAAEEIFGNEVENRGGRNTLSLRHDQHIRLVKRFKNGRFFPNLKLVEKDKTTFRAEINYARNAAKHIANKKSDKGLYDEFFREHPKSACITMIFRALHNLELLGLLRSEQGRNFHNWYMSDIYSTDPGES